MSEDSKNQKEYKLRKAVAATLGVTTLMGAGIVGVSKFQESRGNYGEVTTQTVHNNAPPVNPADIISGDLNK